MAQLPVKSPAEWQTKAVDAYPDVEGKIAICLQSSMVAKEMAVSELGVGEDLTFSLFGWLGQDMRVISTLSRELMAEEPEKRLEKTALAATVMRKGWQCDSITFVAEAFCSLDHEATRGKDLRALFARPNSPVHECLTVTHVEEDSVMLVTQPYRVGLGRKVEWMNPLLNLDAKGLRDARYPAIFEEILKMDAPDYENIDIQEFHEALAEGMAKDGFYFQWTFD